MEIAFYESNMMFAATSPYRIHQLVWQVCGEGEHAHMPLIYRRDRVGERTLVRIRTTDDALAHRIQASEKRIDIEPGTSLGFSLRCVPVVKSGSDASGTGTRLVLPRDEEAGQWLMDKAPTRWGFTVDEIETSNTRGEIFWGRGRNRITLNDALITGRLTVEDTEKFSVSMTRGVGRHKGFGYGLMAVRA